MKKENKLRKRARSLAHFCTRLLVLIKKSVDVGDEKTSVNSSKNTLDSSGATNLRCLI